MTGLPSKNMRIFNPVLLCAVVFASLCVPAALAAERTLNLAYDIEWGRVSLAKSALALAVDGDRMRVTAHVESGGVAAFVMKFRSDARADLIFQDQAWHSRRLWMMRQSGDALVESRVEWNAGGGVVTQYRDPPPDLAKVHPLVPRFTRQVLDPYAAIMRILGQVGRGAGCAAAIEVFDGRRHARLAVTARGPVTLARDRRTGYAGPAILCEVEVQALGGHRRKSGATKPRKVRVFLAQPVAGWWIPVRIEVKGWVGRVVARLDASRLSADAGDGPASPVRTE